MRSLNADEAQLWARVTATVRPLSRDPTEPRAAEREDPAEPAPAKAKGDAPRPAPPAQSPRPAIGATLDGSWDKRLNSGRVAPDRIVDLHGHNLDGAWRAIDVALDRAIASGERVLLLITGHERRGEPPVQRGRIRAAVHDWLAASRHAPRIAAVRGAHPRHGGGGSLYVILRRT